MVELYQIVLFIIIIIAFADYRKNADSEREKIVAKVIGQLTAQELEQYEFDRMKVAYKIWIYCLAITSVAGGVFIFLKITPLVFEVILLIELAWKGFMISSSGVKLICRKRI